MDNLLVPERKDLSYRVLLHSSHGDSLKHDSVFAGPFKDLFFGHQTGYLVLSVATKNRLSKLV